MYEDNMPSPHPDPWIDLLRGYVTEAVEALRAGGMLVERSWLDPRDPRDATVVYSTSGNESAGLEALVWDEVTGWRQGQFEGGQPGIRTTLSAARYLGGGVLLDGGSLARRVRDGASEPRREYRAVTDLRDGLDDGLSVRNTEP